jgi:hypothetical protein
MYVKVSRRVPIGFVAASLLPARLPATTMSTRQLPLGALTPHARLSAAHRRLGPAPVLPSC